jgi:hypothetical protein
MPGRRFRIYTDGRVRGAGDMARVRSRLNGKLWEELTEAEHQRFPGDYEARVGQGPIALHTEEHLVSSDRGVSLVRRMLRQQPEALAQGRHPSASPSTRTLTDAARGRQPPRRGLRHPRSTHACLLDYVIRWSYS